MYMYTITKISAPYNEIYQALLKLLSSNPIRQIPCHERQNIFQ